MATSMPIRKNTGGIGSDDEAVPDTDPSDGMYIWNLITILPLN